VQNISLLPLLVAVAALHSLVGMRVADKFRFWTITLAPLPFILCLFSSFVARSGILTSLHLFDKSFMPSALSAFIGCCFLLWLFCVIHAVRSVSISPSESSLFHLDKSEVLFWANVIFVFTAVVVGVATFWPVIWQFIISFDKPFILKPEFYNNIASTAGIILAFLLGVVALTDLQIYRNFTLQLLACCAVGLVCFGFMFRFGREPLVLALACGICAFSFVAVLIKFVLNLIAHLGLLLLVVTVGFSSDKQIIQTVLTVGKKVALGEYELLFESFKQESFSGLIKEGPVIVVTKQDLKKKLWPHRCLYPNGRSSNEVAVRTGLLEDVYISFDRISSDGNVTITAKVKPFMFLIWFSFLLIIAGSALGLIRPERDISP
jgi:cytochrome c-type biogenesis protein CcmF